MRFRTLILLTIAASMLMPLTGFSADPADPIKQLLYPPDLIMNYRSELNLDKQQENTIREELRKTQSAVFDLRWQMKDEGERLAEMLQSTPIDEKAVLSQADKVMGLEQQVKRTHLVMLVRLKNMMTDVQLAQLKEYRASWTPKDRASR
ncbi:MAG: periplasmic heavy metal sensor [Xanthomonadales bacterium]|nr:periplasmic heavy metal sensor [Gammaproteobacteria bacterium]MBT8054550.1 periplasmic heavy metal sensor [Gammaproteobacteria bacterium]NND57610.1 periplasmic heavy metal sensor [Xanthomonadales bacterium]NNK51334.1 periplasmic heavy metal sensor [Xanthomonadales bacterium]